MAGTERMMLEAEVQEKQEEFIRRERVYKMRTKELRDELASLKAEHSRWIEEDDKMKSLQGIHQEILENVERLQKETARVAQKQERDMLEVFRGRLRDVRLELEKEMAKKDDGAGAWIEKSRRLELDVDKERERADKYDRANQTLIRENARLKQLYDTQKDDKAFLMKQLAAVKRENKRVRQILDDKKAVVRDGADRNGAAAPPLPAAPAQLRAATRSTTGVDDTAFYYRDMIKNLNKILSVERKHVEQVEKAHAEWRKNRTPLEISLREAVSQVASVSFPSTQGTLDPSVLSQFTEADREKAIDLWLSRDGVIDSLYSSFDQDKEKSAAFRRPLG